MQLVRYIKYHNCWLEIVLVDHTGIIVVVIIKKKLVIYCPEAYGNKG